MAIATSRPSTNGRPTADGAKGGGTPGRRLGGPGTPYDASTPDATTDCSYTWPTAGSYTVTATIYWTITWAAAGAAGGGTLGVQPGPAATVTVHVVQSEAINTPSPGGS